MGVIKRDNPRLARTLYQNIDVACSNIVDCEEWNAVCYLAGGPCGSLYWAQREKFCGCLPFVGDLVFAN